MNHYISTWRMATIKCLESCFIWVVLLIGQTSFAQKVPDTTSVGPAVKMQARATQQHIKLRWAPTTPIAWQYGNQYGYQLEKYLVLKNGQVLAKPQKLATPTITFKPLPLRAWEQVMKEVGKEKENYALVAAQALYGKDFGLTTDGKNNTGLKKIINRAKEQEMRFAYALMASDHVPQVARASGLFWQDKNVRPKEKYLYKVFVKLPAAVNYRIDTAYVYTGIDDYEALPKPVEFSATFGNRTVMLTWNRWYYERFYVAYWVERSADGGKNFMRVTKAPIGNVLQEDVGIHSRFLYMIDSLPSNEQVYHYRVRGVNSFGELGPPSETLSGQGWANNLSLPKLARPDLKNDGSVQLTWTFPTAQQQDIIGFVVEKARRANGVPYQVLHPQQKTLPPTTRSFTDTQGANGVAYYRVGVVSKKPLLGMTKTASDIGGNQVKKNQTMAQTFSRQIQYTYPFLVQRPDSVPPQPPTMVAGTIDSTGKVTLRWKPSPDDDVQGYRVYRANYKGEAFSQVTKTMVSDTVFIDSVSLQSLTTKVLYKVQAVDEYINPSELSKVGVLKRPDIIPPVPPVFTQVISADSGVYLKWQASTSTDVAHHAIYRQERGQSNAWTLIQNIQDTSQAYADIPPKTGVDYQYTIIAVDSSSLESPPAKPVIGRRLDNGLRIGINKFKAKTSEDPVATVKLVWQYNDKANTETPESFSIYKGEELGKMRLYATVKGNIRSWKDQPLNRDLSYKYRIRANYKRGAVSKFSKLLIVEF